MRMYAAHILYLLAYSCLASAVPIDLVSFMNEVVDKGHLVIQQWPWDQTILNPNSRPRTKEGENDLPSEDTLPSIVSLIPRFAYEKWVESESNYAFEAIIRNIGGYGPGLEDVMPGAVIASPSKQNPNYYYQWTRDAAISINNLVLQHADQKATNATLWRIITDYIHSSGKLQHVDNPSGTFENLEGLGEPKFEVDGKPFTGNWGRPQRDGPALRAVTMSNFIFTEVKYNSSVTFDTYRDVFNNIIRYDLDYVAQLWHNDGFDLWEEVSGKHFYTFMVQHSALVYGSKIAKAMGLEDAASYYAAQAEYIATFIKEKFWNADRGHLVETFGFQHARSGLDSALFLGSLHSMDILNWNGDESVTDLYPPYSTELMASLAHYIASMRYLYPINYARFEKFSSIGLNTTMVGFGVGRYPEDVYNGYGTSTGNPWFLCTATVSQNLYMLADYLMSRPSNYELVVNNHNKALLGLFLNDQEGFSWDHDTDYILWRNSPVYKLLVKMILDYGDSFLDVIREHQDGEGNLSEQFSRYSGYMAGADNLTWSYGAFWQAVRQRKIAIAKYEWFKDQNN